jgi:hypothetical protein
MTPKPRDCTSDPTEGYFSLDYIVFYYNKTIIEQQAQTFLSYVSALMHGQTIEINRVALTA